jgi:hypothetical protein
MKCREASFEGWGDKPCKRQAEWWIRIVRSGGMFQWSTYVCDPHERELSSRIHEGRRIVRTTARPTRVRRVAMAGRV